MSQLCFVDWVDILILSVNSNDFYDFPQKNQQALGSLFKDNTVIFVESQNRIGLCEVLNAAMYFQRNLFLVMQICASIFSRVIYMLQAAVKA